MYKKSTACLMSIKQQEDKTLRSYITCFNKETLSSDEADGKILWPHTRMGYGWVSFYFLYIRTT